MDRNLFIKYNKLAAEAQIKRGTKESVEWFTRRIRKDATVTLERVTEPLSSSRVAPGKMFTYSYDPKLKEKLSFYDTNPLVIILEMKVDGWYGANLHYLPPVLRAKLMEEIITANKPTQRVASILESDPLTKVCLKRYLAKHLVTRPKLIPREEWAIAIQLPFEQFEKATLKQVWADSKKKIK